MALLDDLDLDGACQQGVGGGFGPKEKVRLALDCAARVLREPPADRASLESLVRDLWFAPELYPAGPALHLLLRILSGINLFDRKRPAAEAEGSGAENARAEPAPAGPEAHPRDQAEAGPGKPPAEEQRRWYRVTEAAQIAGCNRGVITKAVNAGRLRSNGLEDRQRRVDPADLARWMLARAGKPEPGESTEAVERLIDKHVRD